VSIIADVSAAKLRFSGYILRLRRLLSDYGIEGDDWYDNLKNANRNPEFIAGRDAIWRELLEQESGKLSLGAIFGIVGAALGGVGIAAGGGAIGIPLVLLLVPAGLLMGNEFDSHHVGTKLRRWWTSRRRQGGNS
jgi:hypothetical protein